MKKIFFLFLFFLFFLFFFLFFLPLASSSVFISEIMYDPNETQGNDKNGEWIEIYNSGETINLSGWIIKDKGSANTTLDIILQANSYLIIADNKTNFENVYNCCVVVDGSFGLNNDGDEIWLYNESSLIDYVNYTALAKKGESLQLVNGSWCAATPTPGSENICMQDMQDMTPPSIALIFPPNNTKNTTNIIDFYYNVTDNSSISNCSLIINSVVNKTASAEKNTINNITIYLERGNYTWQISCVDTEGNEGKSETRNLEITTATTILTILKKPTSTIWGSTNFLEIKFDSAYYLYNKIRFSVYGGIGNTGAKIVRNKDWGKVLFGECQDGIEINTTNKTHFLNISFLLYKNCENYYEDGIYNITLRACNPSESGWQTYNESTFSIAISGKNSTLCGTEEKGELSYLLDVPAEIIAGKNFSIKIEINNTFNTPQQLSIWSYVYRGNKCYSCKNETRKSNMENITIAPFSSAIVELWNIVEEAEEGEYKIKIEILNAKLAEYTEYTYDVRIKKESKQENKQENETRSKTMGKIIYESSSEKHIKYVLLLMIIAFLFLFLIFYFLKKKK